MLELAEVLRILAPVVIAISGFYYMHKNGAGLTESFNKLTDTITSNANITAGLEKHYDALPDDLRKIVIDAALDAVKHATKLTPSPDDDKIGEWADELRDGTPAIEKKNALEFAPKRIVPGEPD